MAEAPLGFSFGFPVDTPTPAEQDGLSTQLAIVKGTAQGIQQAGKAAIDQALAEPMMLADQLVDQYVAPFQQILGSAGGTAIALGQIGSQAAIDALQEPLRQGIAMGYLPQNPALLAQSTQGKRQRKRAARNQLPPPPQTGQPPPLQVPPPLGLPPALPTAAAGPQPIQKPPPPGGTTAPTPSGGAATTTGLGFCSVFSPSLPMGYQDRGLMSLAQCQAQMGLPSDLSGSVPRGPLPTGYQWLPEGGSTPIIGGQTGITGSTIPLPPAPPSPPSTIPLAPPSPPPCPCPNINISIPITPPPAPNVYVYVPPCPNCGTVNQPYLIPTPQQSITINTPPCPTCQLPQPIINITVPVPVSQGGGGGVTGTVLPSSPPPVSPGASPAKCPTCTIPWLCLNHPQFVLASKAARKSDFDILVDAVNLGLCCDMPTMPACSMPMLQREFPDFVQAAKAQGLSDDQTLQQAVNIGLCADVLVETGLGETYVGYIAPGSAAQLEKEYDPTAAAEAPVRAQGYPSQTKSDPFTSTLGSVLGALLGAPAAIYGPAPEKDDIAKSILAAVGQGQPTDCPLPFFRADLSGLGQGQTPDEITACLGGLARPALDLVVKIVGLLKAECECGDKSLTAAMTAVSVEMLKENSLWSRVGGFILRFIVSGWRTGICFERDVADALKAMTGCEPEIGIPAMLAQAVTQLLGRWAPILPGPLVASINQLANWSCPVNPPSAAEANALRAAGWISDQSWECMVRANGFRPDQQIDLVAAQRRRPSDGEVLMLERKKLAKDNVIADYYAHNGWTGQNALADWKKAQQWVASSSDVINWMIKDVDDPQITETFLTGAEFKQKYQGHTKEVFDWNGISQQDAESLWRAHWRNMAPTTLYELHKRLRPGWTTRYSDAEVLAFAAAICPRRGEAVTEQVAADRPISNGWPVPTYCDEVATAPRARDWMNSLITDGYHVSEALGQADYPAFWRQRLLALSYRVLNRTDLGTAYVQGSITPARLLDGLLDLGYISSDALALQRQDTFKAILRFVRNPACTQYIRWGGDIGLVEITLLSEGMALWMWPFVQYLVSLRRLLRVEQQFLRAIQAQYAKGKLSDANAQKALQNYSRNPPQPPSASAGFPQLAQLPGKLAEEAIKTLLDEMKLLKQATPKSESATQICQEFKTGLITGREALAALIGLGYTAQSAQKILSLCYLRRLPSTLSTMPAPGTNAYAQMQQALEG